MSESDNTPAVENTANLAETEGSAPQAEETAVQNEAVQDSTEVQADTESEQESRRDTKAEKRIKKLDHRAKEAEDTVRALEAEKVELKGRLDALKPPTEEEFDYDQGAFNAALIKNAVGEGRAQDRLESNDREIARVRQQQEAELTREIVEKVEEFKLAVPDYVDSVRTIAHLTNLTEGVSVLDKAPEVLYALSKNHQEAVYINSLPMAQQLVALGQFSANISVKPKTVSNAPAPIESAQGGSSVRSDGYRDDMSMEEFSQLYDQKHSAAK